MIQYDQDGKITGIDGFFCGKSKNGQEKTCFQAYGFGKRVLQNGMISILLIKLPLILITGYLGQITVVWAGFALGDLLTAFLAIGMYSRYIRKNVFD